MDPETSSALNQIAQLLKSGDGQSAQTKLIQILKTNPDLAEGWYLLSFLTPERQQIIFALQRVLHLNPGFTAAQRRLDDLQKQGSQPEEPVSEHLDPISAAKGFIEINQPEAAQKILRDHLQSNPNDTRAWYLLSFAIPSERGKINVLRQALRIAPDFTDAQTRLLELQPQPDTPSQAVKPDVQIQARLSTTAQPVLSKRPNTFAVMTRYVLRRGFMILATIMMGIYLTVLITNKGGQIDNYFEERISRSLVSVRFSDEYNDLSLNEWEAMRAQLQFDLEAEVGLHRPAALRNILWTYNALRFNWGKVVYLRNLNLAGTTTEDRDQVNALILQYLPNTLLLFGVANLLVFLLGIPFALYLGVRGKNSRLDRLTSMLSPLSSVPSWVHGIMLVTVFAVVLGVLPFGGKYDNIPPETRWGYFTVVARHMILPVTAILLSMFFQLVYSWRTYFLIYADEDYMELARAKGLSPKTMERRYLLRPTMPFILTSFALSLVGFWQMSTALEYFFNWPGIGLLYVKALPNFWGESFFPGEVSIILSVVVMFAYLLGFVVFVLDISYAAIDPRVRLGTSNNGSTQMRTNAPGWHIRLGKRRKNQKIEHKSQALPFSARLRVFRQNLKLTFQQTLAWSTNLAREIRKYPSAIVGLSIIGLFVLASLYTVIALPYLEIGTEWRGSNISEQIYLPKNVPAEWTNWFRKENLPVTMVFSSQDGSFTKSVHASEGQTGEITFTTSFEYPYTTFPQDLYLYIDPTYKEKQPYLSIKWITPDGREIEPKSPTNETGTVYIFSEHLIPRRWVRTNENWQAWFVTEGQNRTPEFYLLFADPEADTPKALPGSYQIEITTLTFEADSDMGVELVLFGQVYGAAGTDYMRRDLIVPLLWGLPFTLAFGVAGAIVTTILAMIIAAAGVWFGGWLDGGIQRLTEANMILPFLAVGILIFAYYGINLWIIMGVIILLNIFGSPTKSFRAAFLQIKEAPYIEAARAYGASNSRIIFKYMIPKIIPVLIPQLVALIPALVFLEATLGLFNVFDPRYPTWGRVIYEAVTRAALWGGSAYWVLEPISLLLLTGVSFALVGFALERILNPRLQTK